MSMKRLGFAALLLIARQAVATNGYFLEGYGTDSKAQAGVGIALPLDSLTVATNPAGLTAVADAVTVGVEIFRPNRSATLVQGGQTEEFEGNDTKFFYLPEIGTSKHINDRLAWAWRSTATGDSIPTMGPIPMRVSGPKAWRVSIWNKLSYRRLLP
jgi:long-chain fatty acid transport protein